MNPDQAEAIAGQQKAHRERVRNRQRLKKFIRRVLKLARASKNLTVYALTFTHPEWADEEWFYSDAHELAKAVATSEGECIWLMLDKSDRDGIHWHAIALATWTREAFALWWERATSASLRAIKVTCVKGQKVRSSERFAIHLGSAIRYRAKRAPRRGLALRDRAVASGPLRTARARCFGKKMPDEYMSPTPLAFPGVVAKSKESNNQSSKGEPNFCARPACGM